MTTQITTLDGLFDAMRSARTMEAWHDLGLPLCLGKPDWTSLPIFHEDAPANTAEIWSWDAERMIVGTCADDIRIVPREGFWEKRAFGFYEQFWSAEDRNGQRNPKGTGPGLSGLTLEQACAHIRDREHGFDVEEGEYLCVEYVLRIEAGRYSYSAAEVAALTEAGAIRHHETFVWTVEGDRRDEGDEEGDGEE